MERRETSCSAALLPLSSTSPGISLSRAPPEIPIDKRRSRWRATATTYAEKAAAAARDSAVSWARNSSRRAPRNELKNDGRERRWEGGGWGVAVVLSSCVPRGAARRPSCAQDTSRRHPRPPPVSSHGTLRQPNKPRHGAISSPSAPRNSPSHAPQRPPVHDCHARRVRALSPGPEGSFLGLRPVCPE